MFRDIRSLQDSPYPWTHGCLGATAQEICKISIAVQRWRGDVVVMLLSSSTWAGSYTASLMYQLYYRKLPWFVNLVSQFQGKLQFAWNDDRLSEVGQPLAIRVLQSLMYVAIALMLYKFDMRTNEYDFGRFAALVDLSSPGFLARQALLLTLEWGLIE